MAAGCAPIGLNVPSTVLTPDLVGPIDDIKAVPGDPLARDVVVGDRTIRVTPDEPRELIGGLLKGALFIYGDGDNEWYVIVGPVGAGELRGCFGLSTFPVVDDGTHLIFRVTADEGVRLPKAADLELPSPDPETGVYPFPGATYCIEADGTVSGSDLP